jgi:hypothetical protein
MKPTDCFKKTLYYHGTRSKISADGIIDSGYLKAGKTNYEGVYKPVDKMVYISPDPRMAIVYSCGDTLLSDYNHILDFNSYHNSYLIEIEGNNLIDIQPDEDFLAFALYEYVNKYHIKFSEEETSQEVKNLEEKHWVQIDKYVTQYDLFSN